MSNGPSLSAFEGTDMKNREFPSGKHHEDDANKLSLELDPPLTDTTVNRPEKIEMRPSLALQTHREAIRQIVLRHHVKQVRVFGSVLHGDDTDNSDLDLLVDPTPATTLMDIGAIRYELRQLLGIPVDILTPKALPDNCREQILSEARLV